MKGNVISMVELATALCAPRDSGVSRAEMAALRDITIPAINQPTANQAWKSALGELESMRTAAVINYQGSQSQYDLGRLEALRAACERIQERGKG
jgi:hypothetical protein